MSTATKPEPPKRDFTREKEHLVWETDRYRLVDVACAYYVGGSGIREPPELKDGERLVSMAAHPMGLMYLIEKAPKPGRARKPVKRTRRRK